MGIGVQVFVISMVVVLAVYLHFIGNEMARRAEVGSQTAEVQR